HHVESSQLCIANCLEKLVLLLKHVPVKELDRSTNSSLTGSSSMPLEWRQLRDEAEILSYTVTSTDTLTGIGLTFNMHPQQIKRLNKLYSDRLIPGQVLYLKVPGASTPSASDVRRK